MKIVNGNCIYHLHKSMTTGEAPKKNVTDETGMAVTTTKDEKHLKDVNDNDDNEVQKVRIHQILYAAGN